MKILKFIFGNWHEENILKDWKFRFHVTFFATLERGRNFEMKLETPHIDLLRHIWWYHTQNLRTLLNRFGLYNYFLTNNLYIEHQINTNKLMVIMAKWEFVLFFIGKSYSLSWNFRCRN